MTLTEWKQVKSKDWKTAPISPTCEVMLTISPLKLCEHSTTHAYPAMGGGWMSLCHKHSMKHKEAFKTDELIASGETWA